MAFVGGGDGWEGGGGHLLYTVTFLGCPLLFSGAPYG